MCYEVMKDIEDTIDFKLLRKSFKSRKSWINGFYKLINRLMDTLKQFKSNMKEI